MSTKTSHRRKNVRNRNPLARELEGSQYHQQVIDNRKRKLIRRLARKRTKYEDFD